MVYAPHALDRLRPAIDGPLGATLPAAAARAGLSRGRAACGHNVLHAEGEALQAPLGDWYRVDRLLPVGGAWVVRNLHTRLRHPPPRSDEDHVSSTNPHDAYFREMFSQPARLAGLLRSVLDPGAAARLDLDALTLDPERYLTESLDDFEVDLVARVPVRPTGVAFVCVLVEHQSTPDEYMALRVLLYCTRIWEKIHRDSAGGPRPGGLPPIVPVVVYTGDRPWRAPRSLHGLMPALAAVPELRAFVPNVTLCLDELRRVSDADLDARPLDLPGRIALTALKHGRDRRIGPHVAEWLRRLHAHDRGRPPALQDLSRLVEYLLFAQPHLQEWMMSWMTENPPRPVPGSIVDRWLHESEARGEARGHAAGESEGRAAGVAEGRAAGEAAVLRRLLERRFGPLSAETEACLATATLADLDRWADAILDAACLEDVFR